MSNATAVIKDPRFLDHVTRYGHPECPQRLENIYAALEQEDVKHLYQSAGPREASVEEIMLNHAESYIQTIKNTAGRDFVTLDPDTNTSAGSWQASVLAAGAVLKGLEMILDRKAANCAALVRPPGHHAERARAMGFCLFNNIAIGARYLMEKRGIKRILVVDWDIHHGNGTQNAFYDTPEVLYFSTHQYPYFPGTGAAKEVGMGSGEGYTVNVPLHGGQGTGDYLYLFSRILQPIAEEYKPEFILVSAGYDIYERDPLGTMDVSAQGFGDLTAFMKSLADRLCGGRLLLSLEGGYHLQGIADSVTHTVHALAGDRQLCSDIRPHADGTARILSQSQKIHSQFWPCLK